MRMAGNKYELHYRLDERRRYRTIHVASAEFTYVAHGARPKLGQSTIWAIANSSSQIASSSHTYYNYEVLGK